MEAPYEILIKYCKKQTTTDENRQVEHWLSEGDNLSLFLDLKKEWKYIDDEAVVMPDKHLVWQKIKAQTKQKTKNKSVLLLKFTAIAASILLLIVSGLYIKQNTPQTPANNLAVQYTTVKTGKNEKSKVELSDGTHVWLNADSHIAFGNNFNTDTRDVNVTGELFFEVKPANNKFTVDAGKIKIEVLGTSFNIKTSDDGENLEVILKEGKVSVVNASNNKQLFEMAPSQKATINKANLSHTITETKDVSVCNVWTAESLPMYNEPLSKIISKLESWYGVEITYSGLDPDKRYSFDIQNESLSDFLDLFSSITPIEYNISNNKVSIKAITQK